MAAITDLQFAPGLLTQFLTADLRCQLLNAAVWLDPYGLFGEPEDDDPMRMALHICRECFPVVYAETVQLQWLGGSAFQLERCVLNGINRLLVYPLDQLEDMQFGPPLDFSGLMFPTTDTPSDEWPDERLPGVFSLFGLTGGKDQMDQDADLAMLTAHILIKSLEPRTEPAYVDLANLLQWMFSLSGNTAIDYTLEAFWDNGYDLAQWTPDDIAFMNEINREAHELLDCSIRALDRLNTDSALLKTLKRNIRTVNKAVLKHIDQKGRKDNPHARLYLDHNDESLFIHYARWT